MNLTVNLSFSVKYTYLPLCAWEQSGCASFLAVQGYQKLYWAGKMFSYLSLQSIYRQFPREILRKVSDWLTWPVLGCDWLREAAKYWQQTVPDLNSWSWTRNINGQNACLDSRGMFTINYGFSFERNSIFYTGQCPLVCLLVRAQRVPVSHKKLGLLCCMTVYVANVMLTFTLLLFFH